MGGLGEWEASRSSGLAGAAGTVALNTVTYLDMTVRGRPASATPERKVGAIERKIGRAISDEGAHSKTAASRRSGLGALMGIASGLSTGFACGFVRSRFREVPLAASAVAAGVGVNVVTVLSTARLASPILEPGPRAPG